MPHVNVSYGDPFQYYWDEIDPREWYLHASVRECSEEQLVELRRLEAEYKKFQELLKTLYQQPDIDSQTLSSEHHSCAVCGDCVTCKLRPCRDGGEHRVQTNEP